MNWPPSALPSITDQNVRLRWLTSGAFVCLADSLPLIAARNSCYRRTPRSGLATSPSVRDAEGVATLAPRRKAGEYPPPLKAHRTPAMPCRGRSRPRSRRRRSLPLAQLTNARRGSLTLPAFAGSAVDALALPTAWR